MRRASCSASAERPSSASAVTRLPQVAGASFGQRSSARVSARAARSTRPSSSSAGARAIRARARTQPSGAAEDAYGEGAHTGGPRSQEHASARTIGASRATRTTSEIRRSDVMARAG